MGLAAACNPKKDSSERALPSAREVALATPASFQESLPVYPTDFDTDYLMGKFDPGKHESFVPIDPVHTNKSDVYLRRDTYESFRRMYDAALTDGVKLVIVSATRNFNVQKSIWEAKWTGARLVEGGENLAETTPDPKERALKILRYSSMPGTSRHHWGTDIDLNNLTNSFFDQGEGRKIYDWLTAHAAEYGFCQPYTEKGPDRPNGYNEERWHWSYIPVAEQLTNLAAGTLTNDMISGFQGAESAPLIDVVDKYVLGVNPACL